MSFIRPEIISRLIRWREVMAGLALSAMGIWYAITGVGNIAMIGIGIAMAGAILLFTGFQRARFRAPKNGPGMVEIVERQVTYFGAVYGTSFSFDQASEIAIETSGKGSGTDQMFWIFDVRGEGEQRVPAAAVGAEGFFDALAGFNGANYQKVIEASQSKSPGRYEIWQATTH